MNPSSMGSVAVTEGLDLLERSIALDNPRTSRHAKEVIESGIDWFIESAIKTINDTVSRISAHEDVLNNLMFDYAVKLKRKGSKPRQKCSVHACQQDTAVCQAKPLTVTKKPSTCCPTQNVIGERWKRCAVVLEDCKLVNYFAVGAFSRVKSHSDGGLTSANCIRTDIIRLHCLAITEF